MLPVDIDAGLSEHQVPEVHENALPAVEGGQGVVDHEPAPGQPECGKDCDNCDQHLHHLRFDLGRLEERQNHLQARLIASVVVLTGEGARSCVEEHLGNQTVEADGEDERDEVEKCNVREEHCNVDGGVAVQFEITFWRLK